MFEAMPRATAYQPNVLGRGVPVNDESLIRTVLVLTDARLKQRSIFHCGKPKAQIIANSS
jgi:hypothetical protein